MSAAHQPYIKWFPTDWRADPRLRMCSLAARGLWIELIGYMHEGEPYGHLTINGLSPAIADTASLVGRPLGEVRKAMAELEQRQVYSLDDDGRMFSRRMVRDKAKAENDRLNGKSGGNPKLKVGVNPPDKAQSPEAIDQKKDAADAALFELPEKPSVETPEAELYQRGKELLGPSAGGLIKNLVKAKGGSVPLARAALETASTKQDRREYIGRIVKGSGDAPEDLRARGEAW